MNELSPRGLAAAGLRGVGRFLSWRGVLLLIAGMVLILSISLGGRLVQGMKDLRSAPLDNVQWTLSQVEVDHIRYWNALLYADAARGTPEEAAAFGAVRRRFDLLYSRIAILTDGRLFAALREVPRASAALGGMSVFLDRTAAIMDRGDAELAAWLPELVTRAEDLFPTIRNLSLEGVGIFAVASDQEREHFERLLLMAFLVAALFIVLLLGLLVITARQHRTSERRGIEIARGRARLDSVVGAALDGILAVDAHGRVIEFNSAAEEIFGYSRAAVIGRDIADLIVPPSFRAAHHEGMARFRRTGEKRVADKGRIEITAMRSDGTEFPAELSVRTMKTDSDLSFVAFLRDITDQRAAAQALEAARDQALAADKAKSRFVAMMSHEMRTPLNGLIGMLDMLATTDLTRMQREYLQTASSSGDILLWHVNDILDIAQLEANRLELRETAVDLRALTTEVIAINRGAAERKGLAIHLHTGDLRCVVNVDSHRLRQVLMNLIGNAVKFTETGRVDVDLSCDETPEGRVAVEIAVRDTGPGIPAVEQERVFEDFVTLQNGYDRRETGSGLGLAITRRIVSAMGGKLTLEAVPGGGSKFTIRVDLTRAATASPQTDTPGDRSGPTPRRSVLVVEDNEVNRQVARHMLEAAGHAVTEASDGEAGVRLAAGRHFDLVLMDVSMPGMDGIEATRQIRRLPAPHGAVPVIGLTAHAMPEERARFAEAGMQHCLIKPIRMEVIARTLADLGAAATGVAEPPDAPETGGEIIDTDLLAELAATVAGSDLADLLGKVIDEIGSDVPEIQGALRAGNLAMAGEVAHRLAGATGLVGASKLTGILSRIETAAKRGDPVAGSVPDTLGLVAGQTIEVLEEVAG